MSAGTLRLIDASNIFLPHANFSLRAGPSSPQFVHPFSPSFVSLFSSRPLAAFSASLLYVVRTLVVVMPTVSNVCACANACAGGQLIAHARSRSPTREKSEFRAEIRCTKKRIDSKGKPVAPPLVTGCTRSFRVFTRVVNLGTVGKYPTGVYEAWIIQFHPVSLSPFS